MSSINDSVIYYRVKMTVGQGVFNTESESTLEDIFYISYWLE